MLATVFMGCKTEDNTPQKPAPAGQTAIPASGLKVAYVNTDSVLAKFDMVDDLEEDLLQEKMTLESRLKGKITQLEKEYAYAQQEAPNLPPDRLQALQMEFAQKEQNLMLEKQELEGQLMQSEQGMNQKLYETLQDFLKQYSEREGYDFILGYNTVGDVMYAAPRFNITELVIDSLNTRYNATQETASK